MKNTRLVDKPLFFLFTCVKDGNNYIDKLFDSLLSQTRVNFVHFIYEDGSSIPLGNKFIEYKKKASKLSTPYEVIYEYNPVNIGLNKATQYCISKCNCPYFIWIDCDNYVDVHFFEELEKTLSKHKNVLLARTVLNGADDSIEKPFSFVTFKDAKSKYQLGLLARGRYYYSFFAVNYERYRLINPSNILIDERDFYNDEQIYTLCYISGEKHCFSSRAIGYFSTREEQESLKYRVSSERIIDLRLRLCKIVSSNYEHKLRAFYDIKKLYEYLFSIYRNDFEESINTIKKIKKISKENNISLKNYYDYSIPKKLIKIYYWRLKRKWKN